MTAIIRRMEDERMHWVISVIALVCAAAVAVLVIVGLLSVLRKSARFVGRTALSVSNNLNGAAIVPPPSRARRHVATSEAPADDTSDPAL